MDKGAAVAGASVAAAAAYLDAKYHISHDVSTYMRAKKYERDFANAAKQGRASLWYRFEDQVRKQPANQECLWSRMGCYTWQQTYANSCRYAQFMLSHGVERDELVAFYLMNSPEFVFSYLGSWAIGSAPALINYNLSGDALIHCLKLGGGKVVLVDEDSECQARIEAVRDRIEGELGMKIVILDTKTRDQILSLEPKRPDRSLHHNVDPIFPMCLIYTSGTTGLPKACAFQVGRAWNIGEFRRISNKLKAGPGGDRWYDCMPLYHGTGNTVLVGGLITGVTVCIGRKFSVSRFWEDVRDSRATTFVYVGETARYLVNAPPSPRDREHNIRSIWGNGMRPDVWERFRERFGIPHIVEFFNSTEGVFALFHFNSGPYTASAVGHHGAIARWMNKDFHVPVALDYEKGDIWTDPKTGFAKRVPYEEGGEIICAIPHEAVFGGYWNNPSATEKKYLRNVFKKGDLYYRTGDALRRTEDGRWYFMDRLGDTFRWKGENVSTAEVAEHMGKYPGLHEANVYGVELPAHDGRAGCAALYIDPGNRASFDYKGLLDHSRKTLPKYAVPLFLRIIHEQNLGHNNKQNKVPYRNEGANPKLISEGQVGPRDTILWAPQGSSTYVPFGQREWDSIVAGKARL